MVAKLSSVRIMSAALLATSVPERPMAQPMSAAFRAGASLTPSPVMAATMPRLCQARTMRSLCSGDTRAYTENRSTSCSSSSWGMKSKSSPVRAVSPGRNMSSSRAMATAVILWSPVIITGRMPARWHRCTASRTSSRGGSIIPTRPEKVSSCSNVRLSSSGGRNSKSL